MGPDNETRLCKNFPNVQSTFDEFMIRLNVLKTNPHMKNFYDRLVDIEKTVKGTIETIGDWQVF
jgi:hypothetical protein